MAGSTMGRGQPESAPEQLKACLECQKRKSRCTGEVPCAFCHKAKRSCVYTPRPQRTPLTRKNLDAAEQKCQKLASMLKSLNPDVDIESLLKDSETSINSQLASLSSAGTSPPAPTGSSRPMRMRYNLQETGWRSCPQILQTRAISVWAN
jgi:transcriptional regulatory protein GAL4